MVQVEAIIAFRMCNIVFQVGSGAYLQDRAIDFELMGNFTALIYYTLCMLKESGQSQSLEVTILKVILEKIMNFAV